jgi:hypothetical protein
MSNRTPESESNLVSKMADPAVFQCTPVIMVL